MASSILKGLVANYGKLGYQLWHRPFKMASLVYEREIGDGEMLFESISYAEKGRPTILFPLFCSGLCIESSDDVIQGFKGHG